MFRIGTAGWSIPKPYAASFPARGSHLQRYAQRFRAVEINSSFYRPHKPETYARWAAGVPDKFRFAVKVPREVTHVRRLAGDMTALERFLAEVQALGDRLGPLLVQLPPSLAFDQSKIEQFFVALRARFDGVVVCEPRHPTWFTGPADLLLANLHVARVAADPALNARAAMPGGWPGLAYFRLHGSPRMYYSGYTPDFLESIAGQLLGPTPETKEHWCIFDNTALGEAARDALAMLERLNAATADQA